MNTLAPQLLTDLTRLPEIYTLRVACWEQSPGVQYVNSELFPDGWHDALDTHPTARHWVVEDGGHIVAAARVVVLDSIEEIGQDFSAFELPEGRPFSYLSRLVILPAYRKQGLATAFDLTRMAFLKAAEIAFALAAPVFSRSQALHELGWMPLGMMTFCYGTATRLVLPLYLWHPERSAA